MVALLSSFIYAATVTLSLTANERILSPTVTATVLDQPVAVTMRNPSGDLTRWVGSCDRWPTIVQATMVDLAGNVGTACWDPRMPEMPDVPDLRLAVSDESSGSGSSCALPPVNAAFDLFDFVRSYEIPYSQFLFPERTRAWGNNGPPWFEKAWQPMPFVTVNRLDVDEAQAVVSSTSSQPGWAALHYLLLDGRKPGFDVVASTRGHVKYSSFSLDAPGLLTGRMFDITAGTPPLVQTWTGRNLEIRALPSLVSPQVPVRWSVYVNDMEHYLTSGGELLGVNPIHAGHGPVVSHHGWIVRITENGVLSISGSTSSGEGPYLLGVLARNESDERDADAGRFLLSKGLLAECYPYPPATHEKSETLDGLTPGPIPPPSNPSSDVRVPIQEGSHWGYHFLGNDIILIPGTLEVVDLFTDPHLPKAAHPMYMRGLLSSPAVTAIATGNALKVTLVPTGTLPTPGVRLFSRAFTGLRTGDVLTFAANIATDVRDATHSPTVDMAMASGWGEVAAGIHLSSLAFPEYPQARGTLLGEYQPTMVPWANEGWQTLSVNYTPPLSPGYLDADSDGDCDDDDRNLLTHHPAFGSLATEGWEDGLTVAKASIRVHTREAMTKPFHVWLDNLRVYRSAYELDLALSKTEFTEPASLAESSLPPGVIEQAQGEIDGSFDSYANTGSIHTDLSNIGWLISTGAGPAESYLREPFGPFPGTARYADPADSAFSIRQGQDHTGTGAAGKCLQIALTGPDGTYAYEGPYVSVRASINTAVVAVPGSGIYCFEAYVSKAWPTNIVLARQSPAVGIVLGEIAPNPLDHYSGAYFYHAGLPKSVADPENPWLRVVGTAYIPAAQLVRGILQVSESFLGPVRYFGTPILFDDCHIYRVDDPAHFFDADLFDTI